MSVQVIKIDHRSEPMVIVALKYNDPIAAYRTREYAISARQAEDLGRMLRGHTGGNPWIELEGTYVNMAHVISLTIKE